MPIRQRYDRIYYLKHSEFTYAGPDISQMYRQGAKALNVIQYNKG